MFELVFLGTSASAPAPRRNLPALVIKHDEYRFLVDCGEGTQRQILQAGIGFKRLNNILITHGHLDHILGLAGLLSTYMRWEMIDEMNIYGGKNALDRIHELLYGVVLRGAQPQINLHFNVLSSGPFFDGGSFTISAFPVQHRGSDNLGYVFEEKGRRPFLNEKAEALGIPPGPIRRKLVDGESITLDNGRVVAPEDVLGEYKAGTRLVVVGDTGNTENLIDVCRNADGLVIESTYLQEEAEMASQFGHLTAKDSALLAKEAGVKQLFLTHLSRRYREKDVQAEAQQYFENVQVARDFDTFIVRTD
ncbi:MAG: ribonuclease Z [Anaerolineaceae bacterium]